MKKIYLSTALTLGLLSSVFAGENPEEQLEKQGISKIHLGIPKLHPTSLELEDPMFLKPGDEKEARQEQVLSKKVNDYMGSYIATLSPKINIQQITETEPLSPQAN